MRKRDKNNKNVYGAEKLDPMPLLRLSLGAGSYCSRPIVFERVPTVPSLQGMYRSKNVLRGGGGRAKGVSVTNSD